MNVNVRPVTLALLRVHNLSILSVMGTQARRTSYSTEEFSALVARESDDVELKTGTGGKPLQEAWSPSATLKVDPSLWV